jgi:hypothetical protein
MSIHNEYYLPERSQRLVEMVETGPHWYTIFMPPGTPFPCPVPDCVGIFDSYATPFPCPVPDCVGIFDSYAKMRAHFWRRHTFDTIVIFQEGLLPRCYSCGMFTSVANQQRHLQTQRCRDGAIRQRKRELELLFLEHQQSIFVIDGEELEAVDHFTYLGRPISATGSDWPVIQHNIKKARQQWAKISKILTWEGSSPKVMGYYYKAVCQAILLYGCETWVITEAILNKLESFHHRVARQISRHRIHPDPNTGEWIYPPDRK